MFGLVVTDSYPDGLPIPNDDAALSESMRAMAATRCFALWTGSEGFGAWSFISPPTVRVCSGSSGSCSSSATAAYSEPSSPREGMATLPGRSCGSRGSLENLSTSSGAGWLDLGCLGKPSFKGEGANRSSEIFRSRWRVGRGGILGGALASLPPLSWVFEGRRGTVGG